MTQTPYGQQFPPPPPPPYDPTQVYAAPPPAPTKTNGFAIASLVFGILGGILLSVIFGIVALVQIKKRNERGKGMAVAGLVLSGFWTVVVCGVVVVAIIAANRSPSTTTPDPVSQPSKETSVKVSTLKVGDCVNGLEESDNIAKLPAINCSQPHQGEVIGTFRLIGTTYPGDKAIEDEADKKCNDLLEAYSPKSMDDNTIGLFYVMPSSATWARGDREVLCFAEHLGEKKTGSIKA